jgi:hypothetical protein
MEDHMPIDGRDGRSWAETEYGDGARALRVALATEARFTELERVVMQWRSEAPHDGPHARAELAHRRIDSLVKGLEALTIAAQELLRRVQRLERREGAGPLGLLAGLKGGESE